MAGKRTTLGIIAFILFAIIGVYQIIDQISLITGSGAYYFGTGSIFSIVANITLIIIGLGALLGNPYLALIAAIVNVIVSILSDFALFSAAISGYVPRILIVSIASTVLSIVALVIALLLYIGKSYQAFKVMGIIAIIISCVEIGELVYLGLGGPVHMDGAVVSMGVNWTSGIGYVLRVVGLAMFVGSFNKIKELKKETVTAGQPQNAAWQPQYQQAYQQPYQQAAYGQPQYQQPGYQQANAQPQQPQVDPEALRAYSQMLQDGVITQEEFDSIKKKIIG